MGGVEGAELAGKRGVDRSRDDATGADGGDGASARRRLRRRASAGTDRNGQVATGRAGLPHCEA